MSKSLLSNRDAAESVLAACGQQHVMRFWDELDPNDRQSLLSQIESIDWERLDRLIQQGEVDFDWEALAREALPPPAITIEAWQDPDRYRTAWERGAKALRQHRVAFVLTAGGQGTRLGFEDPKGMFHIGPVSGRSLFQIMLEHALARGRQFATRIPVYLMTSPQTDAATKQFLERNDNFGYPEEDLIVFCQGSMPAVDLETGRVLMSEKSEIATSPDGHGGLLQAMQSSGCVEDLVNRGIETLFYGQIDNPLLQVCHPALLGFHLLERSEMTTQVIRKADPLQKVGNLLQFNKRVQIIEYSDMPESLARESDSQGNLRFWAGSIAVHVIERAFLQRVVDTNAGLPFHRAHKKVPYISAAGERVQPSQNNAVKFERFIFDMLPLARRALVCEVEPAVGFAALKNSPPAKTETPDWVRRAMSDLHKRWIRNAGGEVAETATVEISPFFAVDEDELKARGAADLKISEDTFLFPRS